VKLANENHLKSCNDFIQEKMRIGRKNIREFGEYESIEYRRQIKEIQ